MIFVFYKETKTMALFPLKFDLATVVTYVFIAGILVLIIFAIWTMVSNKKEETYAQSVGPPPPTKPTIVDVAGSKPSVEGSLFATESPAGAELPAGDNEYVTRHRNPPPAPEVRPEEVGLGPDQSPLQHTPSPVPRSAGASGGSAVMTHIEFEPSPTSRPIIPISSKQLDALREAQVIEIHMDREDVLADIESTPIQPMNELDRFTVRPESAQYTHPRNRDTRSANYVQRYPFDISLGTKVPDGRRGHLIILRALDRIKDDLVSKFGAVYMELRGNKVKFDALFNNSRESVASDMGEWVDIPPPSNITAYVMQQADDIFDKLVILFSDVGASIDFDGTVAAKGGRHAPRMPSIPAVAPGQQDLRVTSINPDTIEASIVSLIDRTYEDIAQKHRLRPNTELEKVIKMAGQRVWHEYDAVHHQNFPPEVLIGLYKNVPVAMEKVLLLR